MKENGHNEKTSFHQVEMKTYFEKPTPPQKKVKRVEEKIIEINLPSPERCSSLEV